jgi:hypothetical protein
MRGAEMKLDFMHQRLSNINKIIPKFFDVHC